MHRTLNWLTLLSAMFCCTARGQEIEDVAGWQAMVPVPGTHRTGVDLSNPHGGKGAGRITGFAAENQARACFIQDFYQKTAIPAGRTYRYRVAYRTAATMEGRCSVLIDCYTREGEKSHKALVSRKLELSAPWRVVEDEVAVPADAVRVRMLLYLHGKGTVWYDDAFFGPAMPDAANLLKNGGFEPPGSCIYELAPEKPAGKVRFLADFDNATLGTVKQLGPDEYYLHAFPKDKPHSSFLWFHFRVEGCLDREITFHVNPAPSSRDHSGGSGTRLPVMSYDGQHWVGIEDKSWNEDGTVLSFKQRFTQPSVWIAAFFPYTPQRVTRFIEQQQGNPCFQASLLGKTTEGRDMRIYTLTDPEVPEQGKRVIFFTTLHHDLETTGAMAVEGLCRFLLSDDPRAKRLLRTSVFYVVPMMNPDGIAKGNLYCPVGNLNRQWGLGTTAETTNVEKFARALAARGRKIDLFMDFHGWCTPERTTLFMTFGREIAEPASETDALRLATMIKSRLSGKVNIPVWRNRITTVTGITGDLNRLSCGWMKFEAGARLSFSIEIFGDGECTQQGYLDWGRAFAEGIAEFYAP